jgi:energy-coupling factor transporter ATP-binding protein EcfA2
MTLTVVTGASGSGKTTFLEDVHDRHQCVYVRQYHSMRPFIVVSEIPNFDPTQLPFWDIYENENVADSIKAGGTLAGKYTAGLSGGQRKLLLFELIYQRTLNQSSDLLIVLDEPYSGVTDDFVPFIKKRLNDLRQRHNVLLVTNDHVETLTDMADNTIRVSALDRSVVQVNGKDDEKVDREKTILALALGHKFDYSKSLAPGRGHQDWKFFATTEILASGQLLQILIFAIFSFSLYIGTFWDSQPESAPLVLIAGGIIAFFQLNPYILGIVPWRDSMLEESEALVHSSALLNISLKVALTLSLIVLLSAAEFGVVNLVTKGMFKEAKYWVAMLCDSCSLTLPLVCLGLFTRQPFQTVQLVGSLPFLMMVFFSTTFSPGAGVAVVKELRYLFPRYYFWCMVPGIQQNMEGCPADNVIVVYMALSALTGVFVVFAILGMIRLVSCCRQQKERKKLDKVWKESRDLQIELYGTEAVERLRGSSTNNKGSSETDDRDRSSFQDSFEEESWSNNTNHDADEHVKRR